MDKRKDLHVTHRKSDGKWQMEEAIQAARDIAIDRGVSVVIHGMDGKIREVYSYDDRKQK